MKWGFLPFKPARGRGREPVELKPPHLFAPHAAFTTKDAPLLLSHSYKERDILLFRWRDGRLERLEPVRVVGAFATRYDAPVLTPVEVYRLDFPADELAAALVFRPRGRKHDLSTVVCFSERLLHPAPSGGEGAGSQPEVWKLQAAVEEYVEKMYGKTVVEVEMMPFPMKLEKQPALSLAKRRERGCAFQLLPVVQPGWVTVLGYVLHVFCSRNGREWYKAEKVITLPLFQTYYVPEDYYFLAVGYAYKKRASKPGGAPETWGNTVLLPYAWRLPKAKLPAPLRELLAACGFRPERVELVERIVKEVGPKWPLSSRNM